MLLLFPLSCSKIQKIRYFPETKVTLNVPRNPVKKTCWNELNFKAIEQSLLQFSVVQRMPLYKYFGLSDHWRSSFSPDFLLLDKGLKAIFKAKDKKGSFAALDAYRISQFLGLKLVPPTVMRHFEKWKTGGTVQLFIDSVLRTEKHNLLENLTPVQKSNIYVFYFLSGEIDPGRRHILFEKNCAHPALIDNDWRIISHTQYGELPFLYYEMEGLGIPILTVKDYKSFPFDKVQSLKDFSRADLEKTFSDIGWKPLIEKLMKKKNNNIIIDNTLHFVKWKNGYWVKILSEDDRYIFKGFKPEVFSKKTLEALKKINRKNMELLVSDYSDTNYRQSYINLILYRKNILLTESKKLNWGGGGVAFSDE